MTPWQAAEYLKKTVLPIGVSGAESNTSWQRQGHLIISVDRVILTWLFALPRLNEE